MSSFITKDSLFFVYLKCLIIIVFITPFGSAFYQVFLPIQLRTTQQNKTDFMAVWKFNFDISIGIYTAKFDTFINFYVIVIVVQQVDTILSNWQGSLFFVVFNHKFHYFYMI